MVSERCHIALFTLSKVLQTEVLRPVDYKIAYGVWGDMKEHGWDAGCRFDYPNPEYR